MSAVVSQSHFSGCLLGGMLGDIIGAAVEAESPGYIRKTFQSLDDILALESVPEILAGEWQVGRFTDDTQMTLCVAEWLASDPKLDGKNLLTRFCAAYEPWRRYGPGARMILEAFPKAGDRWPELATVMFPQGSYGNGSAMRVAPVGLFFHDDLAGLIEASRRSSVVTHSHFLAVQGAALQATAVATALKGLTDPTPFIRALASALNYFKEAGQDTAIYTKALAIISKGLQDRVPPDRIVALLGNGIKAQEAVPMAIYCFLANRDSFEKAIADAIYLGGDTDTIACMTGAIAGAALGEDAIPHRWLGRVTEDIYTPAAVRKIASELYTRGQQCKFRLRR